MYVCYKNKDQTHQGLFATFIVKYERDILIIVRQLKCMFKSNQIWLALKQNKKLLNKNSQCKSFSQIIILSYSETDMLSINLVKLMRFMSVQQPKN